MSELERFAELVRGPRVALGEGCALVAAHLGQPDAPERCADRLDALAAQVGAGASLDEVATVLFDELGFDGDRTDYYDPRNSLLPDVLARRRGIPITLSIVVIEVAARVGAKATGVGMPGHFLVGDGPIPCRWLDAYDGGTWLDEPAARARFRRLHGSDAPFDRHFLDPTPAPQILGRVLSNLAAVHRSLGDPNALVRVLELRGTIPEMADAPRSLVEWADALAAVGRRTEAIEALEAARAKVDPRLRAALDERIAVLRAALN